MLLVLRRQRTLFALLGGAKVWEDVLAEDAEVVAAHAPIGQA
jgi:hypothetical protein